MSGCFLVLSIKTLETYFCMSDKRKTPIKETWYSFAPNLYRSKSLNEGEVGYMCNRN